MTHKSSILLIIILSVGLFGSTLLASPCLAVGSSSLTVIVQTASTAVPIEGATVTLYGPETNPQNYTGVTGNDGKVVFSNLAVGLYHILSRAPGYQTQIPSTIQVSGAVTYYASFSYTTAYFTYLPNHVTAGTVVSFDASASKSSGSIVSYSWDFGDNTTGTGVAPSHVYNIEGTYTVLLTVTSSVGAAKYHQLVPIVAVNDNRLFPWILLIIPLLIPFIIFWYRRRRYYVVIQARVAPSPKNLHCPGDGTNCDKCKLTPC